MTQRFWSSLTAVVLGISTTAISQAGHTRVVTPDVETQTATQQLKQTAQPTEVVKVGEYQNRALPSEEENTVARIYAHEWEDLPAATLYVRSIPVLTFLGTNSTSNERKQVSASSGEIKTASSAPDIQAEDDPVQRASRVAAQLNQLHREQVNAENIIVRWQPEEEVYSIRVNGEELVAISEETILPDTTNNLEQDSLQATNRLRRLLGEASPLKEVENRPQTPVRVAGLLQDALESAPVQVLRGMASWYGPGFHGRRSASGERFNQNALTAAHRHLPFGTRVRVTNMHNGRSVVVRINDRGPFIGGRIIDLSAGAARMIGMMNSGVAPVQVEVLD